MDLLDAIFHRRSVRAYTTDVPSQDELLRLVEAAIQAPSAVNRQSWSFTIVRNRDLLATISGAAKEFMTRAHPLALPEHLYEKLADPQFDVFYQAPALIVVSAPRGAPWIVEDCALAAENLMLAAHGFGLGSCWIGLVQPWLATSEGRRAIGLADELVPVAPVIVGRPSAVHSPSSGERKAPKVTWID